MAHQNLSIPHAVFAVTPTLFEELHNWQFQSGVTGRSSLPPCRQNMPALRRQAAMPRPARGGVNLVHGVSLHFLGGCFHLPSFQSILGAAAACSLRFPLHAAALPPRPTCKVCFSKNFLWETSIGCLVFETFINALLQALTAFWLHVAQGWPSRRPQMKRRTTLCTGYVPAAPTSTRPVISQFFFPTGYNHPPWTCPAPWM